jgi:hypothetical protein
MEISYDRYGQNRPEYKKNHVSQRIDCEKYSGVSEAEYTTEHLPLV